ncbi:pyrroline-5-carboxylate reductase 3-like isoform X1 [Littorina saxatilis]|uniref:pyrroline-5-carboxylate reductase 3-like isoform X1 n=1 Tax=Littorina saxatilis TaxID=31220 RepID=UPI0038B568BF
MASKHTVLPTDFRVGFIGAGKMALALSSGFVRSGLVRPNNIFISDPSAQVRDEFKELGVNIAESNQEVVSRSQLIVVSVKPNVVKPVLQEVASVVSKDNIVVSIAAGIKLATIEELLPSGTRVIRVMPNTPCLVQAGAAVVAPGTSADPRDSELVVELLRSVGVCEQGSEKLLDAVTGLSGSGPAYAFAAIEAMADGGVKMGLPRDLSIKLAAQTMLGAAKMVIETGKHPGQLKDEVCSPAGTTIAAVHCLERNGFRAALMDAVECATLRARELGNQN